MRRCADAPVRRCERLIVRGRGRLKKYLGEVIRQDMTLGSRGGRLSLLVPVLVLVVPV